MAYLSWLKFIFDTMLEALALYFHRSQDQAVPYEMRRVSYSFACFKAKIMTEHYYFPILDEAVSLTPHLPYFYHLLFKDIVRKRGAMGMRRV